MYGLVKLAAPEDNFEGNGLGDVAGVAGGGLLGGAGGGLLGGYAGVKAGDKYVDHFNKNPQYPSSLVNQAAQNIKTDAVMQRKDLKNQLQIAQSSGRPGTNIQNKINKTNEIIAQPTLKARGSKELKGLYNEQLKANKNRIIKGGTIAGVAAGALGGAAVGKKLFGSEPRKQQTTNPY